jgi:EpsI family protein
MAIDQADPALARPEAGAPLGRRHMLMGGFMVGLSGLAWFRQPKNSVAPLPKDGFDELIPKNFGDWSFTTKSGLVLPAEDPLSDSLYSHVVTRVYASATRMPVMMLIAYSHTQNGMLQLHRPEICYPAGGYKLTQTVTDRLDSGFAFDIPIRHFSANGDQRSEQVLYWTRIGTEHPTSWFDQRLAVMRANLAAGIPDGILVRVSTIAPDYAAAKDDLEQFVRSLLKASPPKLRGLMIGKP